MRRRTLGLFVAIVALALPCAAWPQQEAVSPAQQEVRDTLRRAQEEIQKFNQGGAKAADSVHPAVKWSARLWELREKHGATPAGAQATGEAFHLLIHAERIPQAYELADRVPAGDSAWESLMGFVLEAARLSKDYTYATRKIRSLMDQAARPEQRSGLRVQLGTAYWQQGETKQAIEEFQTVVREAPGTPPAQQAESALYELVQLATGQPAPQFTVTARGGQIVSLAGYRGRPVVLVFWSST